MLVSFSDTHSDRAAVMEKLKRDTAHIEDFHSFTEGGSPGAVQHVEVKVAFHCGFTYTV